VVSFVFCSFAFKIVNENEMKRKFYIFGVLAALCLLGTGYYAWTLYNAHCKQMAEWNEGAKAAFEEALWMEVNKRAEVPFYSYSSEEKGITTLKDWIPDSVFIISALGRVGYRIERYQYDNSLIKETRKRARLSALFTEYPLSVDTLLVYWDSLLFANQIPVKSQVRYVYSDLGLQNDTVYSNEIQTKSEDSLTVKYMGFRCEHEVTAFISYPLGLSALSWKDKYIALIPWGILLLLYFLYSHLEAFVRRKFVRVKVVEKTIEVEKEVVVEKKVHLANVQIEKAQTFELPDGTIFDAFVCTLEKDGFQQRLQPQSVSLLKLFLRKQNHQLTSDEICIKLWGDVTHTDRLYSAIRRLRSDLKKVKSELFIESSYGLYELKFPISSKESDRC